MDLVVTSSWSWWQRPAGWLLYMLWGLLLTGCAGLALSYEGNPARSSNRLPLGALADQTAVWQTRDLAIHYTAAREGDTLMIDGRVERLGPIKNFANIRLFKVWLHFLDTDGIVLDSRLLWAAGVGGDARLVRWTFSQRYRLPPLAGAFGFSYRGTFSDGNGEDGGRSDWEVRQGP